MRKKLLICLRLCASLLLSLGVFAHAERQLDFVSDYAGLLSEEESRALNERAEAVYRQYGFPVFSCDLSHSSAYHNSKHQ